MHYINPRFTYLLTSNHVAIAQEVYG